MIKGYQKEITVINVYAPNNRDPKVHEIKTDILKGEIDNSTTIFGDFNTTFSIIDKTTTHKISKYMEDFNSWSNNMNSLTNTIEHYI